MQNKGPPPWHSFWLAVEDLSHQAMGGLPCQLALTPHKGSGEQSYSHGLKLTMEMYIMEL